MKKIFLLSILLYPILLSAQVTIDITPDKDNSIYSESTNSNGTGMLFSGQTCQFNNRRALIHFDIDGNLPAGAIITAVSLDLNCNNNGSSAGNEVFSLHPLTKDWGEGTSSGTGTGGPAVAPDATWMDAMFGTSPWTNPGGDFGAVSASTTLSSSLGLFTWSSATMVTDVQNWLDNPSNNFGWILIGDESAVCTARRFGSKDAGTAPVLHITYDCSSTPTASCQNPTIYLDGTGNATINGNELDNGSSATCPGGVNFSVSQSNFNCSDVGSTISVTLTVTDDFGNTDNCVSNVTIEDTLPPMVSCITSGTFMLDGTGNLTLTTGDINNGTSDNCGIASMSLSQTAFDCSNLGTNVITLYATDIHGNTDSCSTTIDIQSTGGLDAIVDNVTDASCFGASDGSISISTTGGTVPYLYDWDNDGTGDFDDTEDLTNLSAGTYTLQVNDDAGCTTQEIVIVGEPAEILPSFNITDVTCPGFTDGVIDMTISNGISPFTIDWDNDGVGDFDDTEDLSNLDDGNYNVQIVDSDGCTTSASTTVNDGTAPITTVTVSQITLISDETNGMYQWLNCPSMSVITGETDSAYVATSNGDYAVIVTSSTGCVDTSSCTTISEVGVKDYVGNKLIIFPNPTNGKLNIKLSSSQNSLISIYDLSGRLKDQFTIEGKEASFDVSHYKPGVYLVELKNAEDNVFKRVVIK